MLKSGKKPLQDKHGALGRIGLEGGGRQDRRVSGPVGGEFGERLGREDERRGRERGEVAVEGGDGLERTIPSAFLCPLVSQRQGSHGAEPGDIREDKVP